MIHIAEHGEDGFLETRFSGRVLSGELERKWPELEAAVGCMEPGFRVLTDLADLEEMEFACADEIQHMMTLFAEAGVKEVIRLIPDPAVDIGFGIMSVFHYSTQVTFRTCESRAVALAQLGLDPS